MRPEEALPSPLETRSLWSEPEGPRLVDAIDRLLDRGVAIRGDLWLTVADVDLVYIGLQVVIASPDAISARSGRGR